jgi:HD domain
MMDRSVAQPGFSKTLPRRSKLSVGSRAWAARSGGALSPRDRRSLWLLGVRGELARLSRSLRDRGGVRGVRETSLEQLRIPDSSIALAAERLCQSVSSPSLQGHCQRTYAWGALLALRFERSFDSELLYVASLLHDLGLTAHAPPSAAAPCFAVSGARAAENFLREQDYAAERTAAIGECITLHLNTYVPESESIEAHLLAAGAALDVAGMRKRDLTRELRAAVLQRHPREGLASELAPCLHQQAASWPDTRVAMLDQSFGLTARLRRTRL